MIKLIIKVVLRLLMRYDLGIEDSQKLIKMSNICSQYSFRIYDMRSKD